MNKILRYISLITFIFSLNIFSTAYGSDGFDHWLDNFKKKAIDNGISTKTVNQVMDNAKFYLK